MKVVIKIVVVALSLLLAEWLVPEISVTSFGVAVVVAIALGVINVLVRPILYLLTLPVTLITFGLFTFILNALLFWGTAWAISGFEVDGFVAALLGSLIVSASHALVDTMLS